MDEIFETIKDDYGNKVKIYTGRYIKNSNGYVKPWVTRVLAWDPGKQMDSAGVCVLDKCKDNIYRVVGLTEWKKVDYTDQYRHLEHMCKMLEVDYFIYDANGVGGTCEDTFREVELDGKIRYPYINKIKMIPINQQSKQFKLLAYTGKKRLMYKGACTKQ